MKICNVCDIEKEYSEFYKSISYKDGYMNQCKDCKKQYAALYREQNEEKIKILNKVSGKKWRLKNNEKSKEQSKNWRDSNKDYIKVYYKNYYEVNIDKISQYRTENKEYTKIYNSIYYNKNKFELRIKNDLYKKERKLKDPLFKLSENIRTLIHNSFNRNSEVKSKKTNEILGCSFDEFKLYLESKFDYWMTWENRGLYNGELNYGWDIDHIIPISSAESESDIIRLNHYTNLQPLCSNVNRNIKKNKLENEIY
jgi:hypothetical protein